MAEVHLILECFEAHDIYLDDIDPDQFEEILDLVDGSITPDALEYAFQEVLEDTQIAEIQNGAPDFFTDLASAILESCAGRI